MAGEKLRAVAVAFAVGVAAATAAAQPLTKAPVVNPQKGAIAVAKGALTVKSRAMTVQEIGNVRALRGALRSASTLRAPGATLSNTSRALFLATSEARWKAADKNHDGVLAWQGAGAAEPLGASANCTVVSYAHTPAKHEKDPAHPGQWIDTPASTVSVGWSTYAEVLAGTSVHGECKTPGAYLTHTCTIPGKATVTFIPPTYTYPSWYPCLSPTGCTLDGFKSYCAAQGGAFNTTSQPTGGCLAYHEYGPDSREAFLAVAGANFDAEDWDKNGVVTAAEGKYLCAP